MAPPRHVARAWVDSGTDLLRVTLARCSDTELAGPSGLPGWTRKHVVAHLAANAEALQNLVAWARTGVETPMYDSAGQRERDIEAGARLGATELREWVERSAGALTAAMDGLTAAQWERPVRTAQGRTVPAAEVPWLRAREVCIHAVDLDAGTGFADLPRGFLAALLDDVTAKRSQSGTGPALVLDPHDEPRTWEVAGSGRPVPVRGSLAGLAAYATGRPAPDLEGPDGPPDLPPWL